MKKLLCLLAVFLLLTGCAGANRDGALDGVEMTLEVRDSDICWTIANQGERTYYHPNRGFAFLQVQAEDGWSSVSAGAKAITTEGYLLVPGDNYSSILNLEEYGDLVDGTYRVVFRLYNDLKDHEAVGFAACPFQIVDGEPQ